MLRLTSGRYQFRVRARTADGYGPWSRRTDAGAAEIAQTRRSSGGTGSAYASRHSRGGADDGPHESVEDSRSTGSTGSRGHWSPRCSWWSGRPDRRPRCRGDARRPTRTPAGAGRPPATGTTACPTENSVACIPGFGRRHAEWSHGQRREAARRRRPDGQRREPLRQQPTGLGDRRRRLGARRPRHPRRHRRHLRARSGRTSPAARRLRSVPGGPGTAWGGQNGTMYVAGDGNGVIQDSALALRAPVTR